MGRPFLCGFAQAMKALPESVLEYMLLDLPNRGRPFLCGCAQAMKTLPETVLEYLILDVRQVP